MSMTIVGGFNGACRDRMSPGLARRIAREDAEYERETARQTRDREVLAEDAARERAAESIAAAVERGEVFSMRDALTAGGVGRTRAEAMEYFSALGDVQDRREAELQRLAQRNLLAEMGEEELAAHVGAEGPSVATAQAAVLAATVTGGGRTPGEQIALMSAQSDLEDAQRGAKARRELAIITSGLGEPQYEPAPVDLVAQDAARARAIQAAGARLRARGLASSQVHRRTDTAVARSVDAWVIR